MQSYKEEERKGEITEIKEKIKNKIHICSNCIAEKVWINNICPSCGHSKFYPYYECNGAELKKSQK